MTLSNDGPGRVSNAGKFGNRDDIPNASGGNIYAAHRPGTVGIVNFVPSP